MLVSVFIPTGNRAQSLRKVLLSLESQSDPRFEIIVVDYRSTDTTQKILDQFKKKLTIHVVKQSTKGLTKAANLALSHAKGDIFTRTDDDVLISPYWIENIIDTFKKDANVGGVTGPTVIPDKFMRNRDLFLFENKFKKGSLAWRFLGHLYFNIFLEGKPYRVSHWTDCGAFSLGSNFSKALQEPYQEVTNLEACNWSARTKLLRQIGGFDESYTGVGEYHEADASFKIKKLGYKLIFNPKVSLNHCPSQDGFFNERPSSYSRMINFIRFYMKHIKPDTFNKLGNFSLYLLFLNCYYIATAVRTRQMQQLGAVPGTIVGFVKSITIWHKKK